MIPRPLCKNGPVPRAARGAQKGDNVDPLTLQAVGTSLLYAFLGMASLGIGFWVFDRLTPYSLWTEVVEKQNTALAIVVAGFAIAIGIIVATAIH